MVPVRHVDCMPGEIFSPILEILETLLYLSTNISNLKYFTRLQDQDKAGQCFVYSNMTTNRC